MVNQIKEGLSGSKEGDCSLSEIKLTQCRTQGSALGVVNSQKQST